MNTSNKYAGWVLAVVTIGGPVQVAYLGKLETDHGDGTFTLSGAVEVHTMLKAGANGAPAMARSGLPLMFFAGITSTRARPLAMHPLDTLSETDAAAIEGLLKEGQAMRDALVPAGHIQLAPPEAMLKLARMNGMNGNVPRGV